MLEQNALGQTINLAESRVVALRTFAFDQQCWWNGIRALRAVYRAHPDARYVEGCATTPFGIVADHAWLEVAGKIVDPTPSWQRRDADRSVPCYFPANRYTVADLKGLRLDRGVMPLALRRHGWAMTPEFREARVAAYAHVLGCTPEQARVFFTGSPLAQTLTVTQR